MVDVAAVPDAEDQDDGDIVVDLVDDAIVARANPPLAGASEELCRGRWPRLGGK